MSKSKVRVVVAMSGGVDSSVCAALLVEQGYDVIGIMLRLWSESGQVTRRDNRCCTRDQMIEAHLVARKLGIPFQVIDARERFKHDVIDRFIEGYSQGLTPNPCLACNRYFRFDYLLNEADKQSATHLATGHYARIAPSSNGAFELRKGIDQAKDQSYVLSGLNQAQLSRVMLPLGHLTKVEVRQFARQLGLSVANKEDSQDLCFVADGDYRRFLHSYAATSSEPGPIVTGAGKILGQHTGLPDYTIGQRKGLGISYTEPLFVIDKDITKNTLIVGTRSELGRTHFQADNMNWISGKPPEEETWADVKIRYTAPFIRAKVTPIGIDAADIQLETTMPDITPGQGAVIYDDDRVVGCGIIAPKS
ncbi:MAG: tRNA 2-thiouridine(34) synthase MnmA [Anaerolineae bacterium]|nr:tRNA 2-thiouridine(34) synthase MnmA [Anaerolineae bacterium]